MRVLTNGPNFNYSTYTTTALTIFVIFLQLVEAGPRYSSRIVETKTGAIRGVILELNSKHLEPVEVFKAVPYASPPIGKLRFESPQKLTPWKGTKLADTFGAVCPQVSLYFVPLENKLFKHNLNKEKHQNYYSSLFL